MQDTERIHGPSCEWRLEECKAKQDEIGGGRGGLFFSNVEAKRNFVNYLGAHICHLARLRPKISLLRGFGTPKRGVLPACRETLEGLASQDGTQAKALATLSSPVSGAWSEGPTTRAACTAPSSKIQKMAPPPSLSLPVHGPQAHT